MKKLRNLWAVITVLSFTALMTGCGGSSDDDDDAAAGGGGGGAPAGMAPASVEGKRVVVVDDAAGSAPREIRFETTGNSFTAVAPASNETLASGTYQFTRTGDNTATLVLTESNNLTRTVSLHFTSETSGSYSFTSSDGTSGTGTFSSFGAFTGGGGTGGGGGGGTGGGGTGGGGTGGGDGTGGGGTGGGGGGTGGGGGGTGGGGGGGGDTGTPPATVSGRTATFNVTSGPLVGATTVTFGAGNTFSASNTGSGSYTYTLSGNSATLVLDYTAPPDFSGDRDTFIMTFNAGSGSTGTFTGTTRIDDAESPHSGTFQFQ